MRPWAYQEVNDVHRDTYTHISLNLNDVTQFMQTLRAQELMLCVGNRFYILKSEKDARLELRYTIPHVGNA
jgi:hypothetical protein